MTEKDFKKLLLKWQLFQAVVAGLVGGALWLYSQGKANADIVHRPELEQIKSDIRVIREDVAYIRGRMEKP